MAYAPLAFKSGKTFNAICDAGVGYRANIFGCSFLPFAATFAVVPIITIGSLPFLKISNWREFVFEFGVKATLEEIREQGSYGKRDRNHIVPYIQFVGTI